MNSITDHPKRRVVFREILIFLGFFVLTAIMTWPWILNVRDAVSDKGDPYLHTYFMWWGFHQTFHDPLNLFDATIFYPYKDTLAFSENDYGIALLFFPLYLLGFRPLTVLSVATLVAFAFSGYGMFRLTRTLTGSWGGALLSGIVFAFIPYHFQRLPHLPLIFAGWIPLVIEAMVLFARRRSWPRAIWLGVAFLMNALTCVVWFTLTLLPFALSALFLLAWWRLWRDRALWIRGGVTLGAAALVLLCFFFPYYRAHQVYGFARSAADASTLSALPVHWLAVSSRNKLWEGLGGKMAIDELTLFPGLLPPLLAIAALLLVRPVSRRLRNVKFSKLWLLIPRRLVLISLDVLAFILLLIALLAKGYDGIHFRLFGVELFRSTHPFRPLIFALGVVCLRFIIASPEIIRRLLTEKNSLANSRTNPRSVALLLGLIWTVTGFLGSFGMNFFFHRFLFDLVIFYRSIRAPVRWAMICYVGFSILAGLGAIKVAELVGRWRPLVPRTAIFALLAILILFEQRVAPIEFAHGEVDPDAITLRLKQTPMSAGIVELPAEKDSYAYHRYVLRAADHRRPIITASSSFAPKFVQQIESLTAARPIPDGFFDLLETIPTSYLVVHNSLLSADSRSAIESLVARGVAAGRLRFINSYGDLKASDDLYAIAKIEPKAQTEIANRIDDTRFFVRQQYLDLLHREPDSTEWDNLAASIDGCNGEPSCLLDRRLQAALGLVHSPEFSDNSYFVYSLYKTGFGRPPKYSEWARDIQRVRTSGEETKLPVAEALVSVTEFLDHYPSSMTNTEYVDKLLRNAVRKLSATEQQALIRSLNDGKITRAGILVKVIKDRPMPEAIYNEAFVTTSYLNYLKRDPDPAGFKDWLRILKEEPKGETALIRGFTYSPEYRVRFGQP